MHKYPATPPLTSPVSQDQTFSQLRARFKGCHACGTFSTPLCKVKILYIGRRGPFGLKTLCNSCGLKYAQGRALLVKPHTALAAAGFEGEMIDKSVKVHQRMYIKNADEPNVILRKQFSPKGNILGQTLILNKSARQLFPETKPPSKKRLTKEKRLELLLKESDEEVDDHEIMSDFLKSVHKRREMLGKLPSISDNGSSRSNHEK
jgi:hypothetical protein